MSPSWSQSMTAWSETRIPVDCLRSFCRVLAVLTFLFAQRNRYRSYCLLLLLGWCPYSPFRSPCVMASLLVCPSCFWDCAGRHSKSSDHMYGCAILEVPCWTTCATWLGCRYWFMLPLVTSGRCVQNHSPFWGCLAFASPLHHFHFTFTKAGEINSWSLVLPKQTDWYPWSLTDLVLYCDDQVFPYLFIYFLSSVYANMFIKPLVLWIKHPAIPDLWLFGSLNCAPSLFPAYNFCT